MIVGVLSKLLVVFNGLTSTPRWSLELEEPMTVLGDENGTFRWEGRNRDRTQAKKMLIMRQPWISAAYTHLRKDLVLKFWVLCHRPNNSVDIVYQGTT